MLSFTDQTDDIPALVEVCRRHGEIIFVLNGSEAVDAPGSTPQNAPARSGSHPTHVYGVSLLAEHDVELGLVSKGLAVVAPTADAE